jgi:cell wall-associated NlpC family hydrolase
MAGQGVNTMGLMATFVGALFIWSGVKGASITGSLRELLSGQAPKGTNVNPIGTPVSTATSTSSTGTPVTTTTSSIANDALKYNGHAYLYGGAPGVSGANPWDCSSFCNWVLGHDLGFTLPGQSTPGYSGTSHGPVTTQYIVWSGAETVGHTAAIAQPGDLCVWQTHMGIAIGNGQMISAQDPALGTGVGAISMPGEMLFVRRVIIGNPDV